VEIGVVKRLGRLLLCALLFVFCLAGYSPAAEVPKISVELSSGSNTAAVSVVEGKYLILSGSGFVPVAVVDEGQKCVLTKEGLNLKMSGIASPAKGLLGPVYFQPLGDKGTFVLGFNNTNYRGRITVHNTDQGLVAVNTLPVEEYLYGVVGQEMGYGAPLEALKAQALVSRSYALGKKGTGLYADLKKNSQAYRGYNAELVAGFENVKEAVDSTAGEVICYQDKIIDAVFHSNSGGFTESSENVWQQPVPYLRAVPSPWDEYALRYSYQDANGWPGNSYEWSVDVTRDQLKKFIADWNAARPNDVINIGEVKNIILSRTDSVSGKNTVSGRVTALTLVGSTGKKTISKDNIRSFFRPNGQILKSTLFDITLNKGAVGESGSKGLFDSITINGRGNGHGLGLSQWGARGMAAEQEAGYYEIVKHYYSDVEIEKLY
jgi:stage II sporulation protein D